MTCKSEWRVRAVTRYIVTKFVQSSPSEPGASNTFGEYEELAAAENVARAMAAEERGICPTWDVSAPPYVGPGPGKVMRCKVVMSDKRPNVHLQYHDPKGRMIEHRDGSGHGHLRADAQDPANYTQDGVNVSFHAVWGGQDPVDGKNACRENRIFADATPSLTFSATVRNPSVTDQLTVGDEFYVDFTPAPK